MCCATQLGLKAARFGCGSGPMRRLQGVDRRPRRGLLRYAAVGGGRASACTTPEGLGARRIRTRCKARSIAEQAAQCGYCLPGILISAAALLERNPLPSEAEVRAALDEQPVPLRRAQSHRARGAARGGIEQLLEGARMNLAFGLRSESGDLPRLPGSLQLNRRLARWLHFLPDGVIEVRSGKVEIGQGILTALAQIAAEELDVPSDASAWCPPATPAQPRRGRDLGQPLDPGLGQRAALCLRRGARDSTSQLRPRGSACRPNR